MSVLDTHQRLISRRVSVSHGDTIDDEHNFSSSDVRLVKEDHPDFRGYATSMCP